MTVRFCSPVLFDSTCLGPLGLLPLKYCEVTTDTKLQEPAILTGQLNLLTDTVQVHVYGYFALSMQQTPER